MFLENTAKKVKGYIIETQEIENQLNKVSNMIQLKKKVEGIIEKEERDCGNLKQLIQCLDRAIEIYTIQENKLLDYEEELQNFDQNQVITNQEIPEWIGTMLLQ